MDPLVHFEIVAKNVKKLSGFYSKTFGWKFKEEKGMKGYWTVITKPGKSKYGINGGMMEGKGPCMNYMEVKNIDTSMKNVVKNGGEVCWGKRPIPGMGWIAGCMDCERNPFGLFSMDKKAK